LLLVQIVAGRWVMQILAEFSPQIEAYSIDECLFVGYVL